MSRLPPFVPLKALLRHVIARDRLCVSALAGTLQPSINSKTAARVLANNRPLAASHRSAILRVLAERLGVTTESLESFDADPLAETHRELLYRSVGETFACERSTSDRLQARLATIRSGARAVLRFDRHLPDDFCFPPEELVVFAPPRQRAFLLHSAFASLAPQHPADRDEPVENLIDQVETRNVDLGIVDDHVASWQPALSALDAFDSLELFDDNVLLFVWRDRQTASLVRADEHDTAQYVIGSIRESVERLTGSLAHAGGRLPVIAFLETMLSPASWRRRRTG